MKKKGLVVLALIAVYLLCFGGYALTVEGPAVKDTLEVVSIQDGDSDASVSPLSTIIPYPPPDPPPEPPTKK
ncbi:hypothetical protein AMJ86_02035 [bacterium SM23_57]|nr:MAG: hypothetical protein AMJ86_02035 [bacterium SM23_57]